MKRIILLLLLHQSLMAQVNLTQGLIGHYPFSGNANDASGNNIHGTVTNATLTTDRAGTANSAYYFNGTSAYIMLPFSSLYNFAPQDSFSISMWILPDLGNSWPAQAVVVKSPTHPDFTLSLWNYGAYMFNYRAMHGYAYNNVVNGTTTFGNNPCWYNVIVTYKNGVWRQYVDGVMESSDLSQTRFILQDGSSRIAFGKKGESNGDYYKGKLDEVRLYNRVLNIQEVNALADRVTLAMSPNQTICAGDTTQLGASGANNYSWSPSTTLTNANIANPRAFPATTTTYTLTAGNVPGCSSTGTVTVTVNPKPVITKAADALICEGRPITIWADGGSSYTWSPAGTLSANNIQAPVATPTTNTVYQVLVTGANGCRNTDSVTINVRKPGTFSISPDKSICTNASTQLTASGGDIYLWSPAASLDNPAIANPVATPGVTTPYSVQITDTACSTSGTLSTTISLLAPPQINITKSNDIDCVIGSAGLTASGASTYVWTPATNISSTTSPSPVVSPVATTTYTVTGTDANNCTNTASVVVEVKYTNSGLYLMPSAFTPNNDGKNDCYGLKYWGGIIEVEFSIFNRWGQRLFYTTNPNECWNGTYKGQTQDPGVFVYMIKAKTVCDPAVFRKGTFTLIR